MAEGVEFDEDKSSYGVRPQQSMGQRTPDSFYVPNGALHPVNLAGQPAMVRFLISHGLAKSPGTAQIYLIGIVIINIIITFIVIKLFL